jgi:hypothetical protein
VGRAGHLVPIEKTGIRQTRGVSVANDRRALRSLAVQFFVNGAVWATLVSRLPAIRDRVGITVGMLGAVLTVGNLSSLVGSFFTARLLAVVSSKYVMIGGGVAYVAALPVIGLSRSPVVLIAGLVMLMWFDVFIDVAMNYQGSVVSARREVPVMSRLAGLWSLGTVAGGVISIGVAGAGISPVIHFFGASLVLLVALGLVAPGLLPVDEPHPDQLPDERDVCRPRWRIGSAMLALGAANAIAVVLDITSGDWATFRLTDDLHASARTAVGAFVAFTAGMTVGRLVGDALVVRVGRVRLTQIGAATGGIGLALATLVPNEWIAVAGFLISGLGTSVLAPQLADTAARAPGPPGAGFKTLFIGHRVAALGAPFAIGGLASTDQLTLGAAMALIGLPAAVLFTVIASRAIHD